MKKVKYIVFDVSGIPVPVIWPDDMGLTHKDVARSVFTGTPKSAGFALVGSFETRGKSISLNLEPAQGDAAILRKHFEVEEPPLLSAPIAETAKEVLKCPDCGWNTFIGVPLGRCNRPGPMSCRGIFPKKP